MSQSSRSALSSPTGSGEKRTLRTVARYAQHWNFVGGAPQEFARKRDVLFAHCQDIGRDPAKITLSSHVRYHPAQGVGALVGEVAGLGEVGLGLAIVYLPRPHGPEVPAPLAEALAPLRPRGFDPATHAVRGRGGRWGRRAGV